MSQLYSFKVSGRTSSTTDGTATGIISTLTVSYDSDGIMRYTDANGKVHEIDCGGLPGLQKFIKDLFTGTGGFDAGSSGVQGHRVFGVPVLKQ